MNKVFKKAGRKQARGEKSSIKLFSKIIVIILGCPGLGTCLRIGSENF
jgi:hypothetical protein